MRFIAVISIVCLAACSTGTTPMSSLPLPDIPRVPNISKAQQPYPDDYRALITRRLMSRGETAEVSEPQPYEPWSINDAVGWSVCLKRADGNVTLVILTTSKVTGTLAPAPAGYCEAAVYKPILRDPLPIDDPTVIEEPPPLDGEAPPAEPAQEDEVARFL